MSPDHHDYVPAAGHDRWLRFYDPLTRLLGARRARERLLEAAQVRPGERVLDLGCGTGELALALVRREPQARVSGLDPDPLALGVARRKADAAGARVDWTQGYAGSAPFPAHSFDRVLSSLVIHHLTTTQKQAAFRDVRRVLRPGGTLHVLDFAAPRGRLERALSGLFHQGERIADNLSGVLPALMRDAGFEAVDEVESLATAFGRVAIHAARAPA